MRARVVVVGSLVAAACSGRPTFDRAPVTNAPKAPATPVAAAPSAAAPIENRAPSPPPVCPGPDELIVLDSPPIVATWFGTSSGGGKGTVDVRWCGEQPAEIVTVEIFVGDSSWRRTFAAGVHALRHGEVAHLPVSGLSFAIRAPTIVTAHRADGAVVTARGVSISVDDPRLVAARAACDQCGGAWGSYGLSGHQRCDCPTHDAGKRCTSRRDCEGACIATGWEPSATPIDGCTRRTLELVGRCHSRQLSFGCLPRIEDAKRACDDGLERRLPLICAD